MHTCDYGTSRQVYNQGHLKFKVKFPLLVSHGLITWQNYHLIIRKQNIKLKVYKFSTPNVTESTRTYHWSICLELFLVGGHKDSLLLVENGLNSLLMEGNKLFLLGGSFIFKGMVQSLESL